MSVLEAIMYPLKSIKQKKQQKICSKENINFQFV